MEKEVKDFLRNRDVPERIIAQHEEENIDAAVITSVHIDDLGRFLPKYGDRVAVQNFCRNLNVSKVKKMSLVQKLKAKLHDTKRKNKADDNSSEDEHTECSKRASRQIEIGWICDGKQVRTKCGGGTRKVQINKGATKCDILELGKTLFFPGNTSSKGTTSEFTFDLQNFQEMSINSSVTVEELFEETKLSRLRFYVVTKRNSVPATNLNTHNRKRRIRQTVDSDDEEELVVASHLKRTSLGSYTRTEESLTSRAFKTTSSNFTTDAQINDLSLNSLECAVYPEEENELAATSSASVPIRVSNEHQVDLNHLNDDIVKIPPELTEYESPMSDTHNIDNVTQCIMPINSTCDKDILPDSGEDAQRTQSINYGGELAIIYIQGDNNQCYDTTNVRLVQQIGLGGLQFSQPVIEEQRADHSAVPRTLVVHRGQIFKEMLDQFLDMDTFEEMTIVVEMFMTNRAKEAAIDDGGVFRDALSEFWETFYETCTNGTAYKVPIIREDFNFQKWQAVAKIIQVGWNQERYFPLKLSPAFIEHCMFESPTPDLCLNLSYILSESERTALQTASANFDGVDYDEILDICSNLDCRRRPTKDNFPDIFYDLAHKEIVQKPKFIIDCWQPILNSLMSEEILREIYEKRSATPKNILDVLNTESPLDSQAEKVFAFLKKFVRESEKKQLEKLLRFYTGADALTGNSINITFNNSDGFKRSPIGHTCGYTLELPKTYEKYTDFRSELNALLSSNVWVMDIV